MIQLQGIAVAIRMFATIGFNQRTQAWATDSDLVDRMKCNAMRSILAIGSGTYYLFYIIVVVDGRPARPIQLRSLCRIDHASVLLESTCLY